MRTVLLLASLGMPDTLALAGARIAAWRRDPVRMVREEFRVEPDAWQVQLLRAFASDDVRARRIAMQACAGPGKSAGLAWCGWHFLATRAEPGRHPNGYAISITGDNLRDNLWKELAVWRDRSEYFTAAYEWTGEKIFAREHPATWWLKARSFPKKADAEAQGRTLSGLHAPYILYLIDESGEMSPALLRTAEQGLGNCRWGKILQAGNPTSHVGMLFFAASRHADQWTVIRITGDPDDPNRSPRIDIEWAREQIANYGRENPWVTAYVLGKFPDAALNTLLGPDEVDAAMHRHLTEEDYAHAQKRLGIDVARFGNDRSVIFPRQGLLAQRPIVLRGARTTDIAAKVMLVKQRWGSELEIIDDTGHWGHGVIDNLIAAGYAPVGVQYHGAPIDKRFKNRRVEGWLGAADWVRRGGALPHLPELVPELTTLQYSFVNGVFVLEDKDQFKRRMGYSPDLGDALANTFMLPEMPSALAPGISMRPVRPGPDWDPYRAEVFS